MFSIDWTTQKPCNYLYEASTSPFSKIITQSNNMLAKKYKETKNNNKEKTNKKEKVSNGKSIKNKKVVDKLDKVRDLQSGKDVKHVSNGELVP